MTLHLDLIHLRSHKFKYNFSDCLDEVCICERDIESTNHFLLQCSLFKIKTFLFGRENMSDSKNTHILSVTIQCILSTDRFIIPLFE